MTPNLFDTLQALLAQDPRFVAEDGTLLRNAVYEAAMGMDAGLLRLLLSDPDTRARFFTEADGILVFDKVGFGWAVSNRAFLPDSYTRFQNKIGLADSSGQLLSASGAQQAAIQHYTYVTKLFMDQLGVAPSEEMVQLYRSLSKSTEGLELDLRVVREELLEKDEQAGAFFCEYAVFQDIYRLEARIARRTGQVIELVMMTLLGKQGHRLTPSDAASSMSDLRSAIHSSLRSGDIFTRSSPIQFLILLPSASYENAVKVCQRILAAFSQTSGGRISTPSYSLLPVLPYKEDKGEDFQPFHRFTTG